MIGLLDLSILTSVQPDGRFWAAVAIAAVAGFVRGFSGFGSALIYVPSVAAIFEPQIAAATLLMIDVVCGIAFAVREVPRCNWSEVVPITIAAIVAIPVGTIALLVVDPTILRWVIAIFVLAMISVIAAGWRYHGPHVRPIAVGAGLMAGFFGGAFQMEGPPAVLFWLGGDKSASLVRANLMVFIALAGIAMFTVYAIAGLLTREAIGLSFWLFWPFVLAMAIGARLFRFASEHTYRRVAYILIYLAAVASLPIFDSWLR
jgi:uncharacterized membrane protein YfcA